MIRVELEAVNKSVTKISLIVISAAILLSVAYLLLNQPENSHKDLLSISSTLLICSSLLLTANKIKWSSLTMLLLLFVAAFETLSIYGSENISSYMLLGIAVLLTGSTLKAVYIPVATLAAALLMVNQFLKDQQLDAQALVSHCLMIAIFGLLSWVSNSKIVSLINRMRIAELDLKLKNERLERNIHGSGAENDIRQITEMGQLKTLASIGLSSLSYMHDLSNAITSLSMDIESANKENNEQNRKSIVESACIVSKLSSEAKNIVNSIDQHKLFNGVETLSEYLKDVWGRKNHSPKVRIKLRITRKKKAMLWGNPLALNHALSTLINNAVTACEQNGGGMVIATISVSDKYLSIHVIDDGISISEAQKIELFKPSTSQKRNGMGVGLYLARNAVESQLWGSIELLTKPNMKMFTIKIPIATKLDA